MGQTYAVNMKLKFRNYENKAAALTKIQEYINNEIPKAAQTCLTKNGILPDRIENAIRIILTPEISCTVENDLSYAFNAEFDASYGWQDVMTDSFKVMSAYLEDDSYIELYPDNYYEMMIIKKGEVKDYSVDSVINPYFDSSDDLYDCIDTEGVYNLTIGEYLYIDEDEAEAIKNEAEANKDDPEFVKRTPHVYLIKLSLKEAKQLADPDADTKWYKRFNEEQKERLSCMEDDEEIMKVLDTIYEDAEEASADEDWTSANNCVFLYTADTEDTAEIEEKAFPFALFLSSAADN